MKSNWLRVSTSSRKTICLGRMEMRDTSPVSQFTELRKKSLLLKLEKC